MTITIQNLSKTYPNGTHALRNISLAIPTGMFGLLGANGAGKSSLMRTLATLQEAALKQASEQDFVMRLGENGFTPDILFYLGRDRNQLYSWYLDGAAELVKAMRANAH